MKEVNVGRLTPEETAELLKQCIESLSEEMLYQTLAESLSKEQKEELSDLWFNLYRKR